MRRLLSLWSIIVLLLLTASLYTHQLIILKKNFIYSDYGKFYQSLQFILQGKNAYAPIYYLPEPTAQKPHPTTRLLGGNLNPPFFNLLLLPLGLLSYAVSFYTWQIISALCGILSALLLKKALDLSDSPVLTLSLIAALFIYYPTYANVWLGQVALLAFPFLLGAWLAAQRGYACATGVLLAIAASIKLFFGLFFLYFLIRREWRALIWFCGMLAVSFSIPLLVFGKSVYFDYSKVFHHVIWYASSWNASLYGFFLRFFSNTEKNIPVWSVPGLANILYYTTTAIVSIALFKFLQPASKIAPQQKIALDFSAVIITIMLISPLGWMYYFCYLFIPFIFLLKSAHEGHYPYTLRLTIWLAIVLTSVPYYLKPPTDISDHLFVVSWASCYTYGLLLLFVLLFFVRDYFARQPLPSKDTCPHSLAIMLYISALLPSFMGILASAHNFTNHPVTTPPPIKAIYFNTVPKA